MKTAAFFLALVTAVAAKQDASQSNPYWVDTHAGQTGNPYWSGATTTTTTNNNNNNNNNAYAYTPKPATTRKPATGAGSLPWTFSPWGWGSYAPGILMPATYPTFAPTAPALTPPAVITKAPPVVTTKAPPVVTKAPVVTTSKPVVTSKPTLSPTVVPATAAPTPSKTAKPTKTPKPAKPTKTPKSPKPTKTPKPTKEPKTSEPTTEPEDDEDEQQVEPSPAPPAPTVKPAVQSSPAPAITTGEPTVKPTVAPTPEPTAAPTLAPTAAPTPEPTAAPTEAPTAAPTLEPTAAPTEVPTAAPTEVPTATPTEAPTEAPTLEPTLAPTSEPTLAPTPELTPTATAAPAPVSNLPASNWPTATDTVLLDAPQVVAAGEVFDGDMKKYDRNNVLCDEAKEMVSADAVFIVQAGGTLKNVILGSNQVSGVYCAENKCALENVWSEDVCQAAVVIDTGIGTTTVTGGGAKSAGVRVIYGKSAGTVTISGSFYMEASAELFESCATCGPVKRSVIVDGVVSVNPTAELVRVNKNYKDEADIVNAKIYTATADYEVCAHYDGGKAPVRVGSGLDGTLCHYTNTSVSILSL